MSLDAVPHPLEAYFPASGQEYFSRLRRASIFHDTLDVREHPIDADVHVVDAAVGRLETHRLDHPVHSIGYRLVEPDGRRMVPELLARFGVAGPAVGQLQRSGGSERGRTPGSARPMSASRAAGSALRSSWTHGCATPSTPWPRTWTSW